MKAIPTARSTNQNSRNFGMHTAHQKRKKKRKYPNWRGLDHPADAVLRPAYRKICENLKAIQKELDDGGEDGSDMAELEAKIKKANMTKEATEKALDKLVSLEYNESIKSEEWFLALCLYAVYNKQEIAV